MENQEIPKIESKEELEETDEVEKEEKLEISLERLDVAREKTKKMNELMEQAEAEENEEKLKEVGRLREEIEKIMEGREKEILGGWEDKEVLEKLFDEQKQKLLDLGYPEALGMDKGDFSAKYVEPLRKELDKVPENVPESNLPFLIVIPANIINLEKKMQMVILNQKTGSIGKGFDFRNLRDAKEIETSEGSYLIYNIENGAKMKGRFADDCVRQFTKENRRGLTTQEGIDLITHYPEILQDHYINLVGSRYGSENFPRLWILDCPALVRDWGNNASSSFGSASCEKMENKKENNTAK